MAVQECPEHTAGWIRDDEHKDHIVTRSEADRTLLREVPDGSLPALGEDERGQVIHEQRTSLGEVGDLVALGAEPRQLGGGEHHIEQHQAFDRAREGGRPAVAIVGLADGAVEPLVMDVVDPPGAAPAGVGGGKSSLREAGEEVARVLPEDNVREGRLLAGHADAGVQHDGGQERRLARREALRDDGGGPVSECHRSTCPSRIRCQAATGR
jgi:hypothetical protein